MANLFGCHDNNKLKKNKQTKKNNKKINANSSKTTEAVGLKFGTNVAWLGKIPNSEKFAGLPLGLVAMATESYHKLIMKMVKLHFLHNQ